MAKHELVTQLFYDGAWHTHAPYDRGEAIAIGRDRGEEQGEPTTGSVEFDLPGHDFNPENVASPLYGKIGRNTPVRMYELGLSFMQTNPGAGGYAVTADHASLDITGDIDIRVDCRLDDYDEAGLAAKLLTPDQKSWAFYLDNARQPVLHWSADGSAATAFRTATAAVPAADGERIAIRVTLDVDNGSAQHVVTFYTAATIAGPWTQLGAAVTTAGVTSIFASTASLQVGATPLLGPLFSVGRFYAFELRNGIGGTLVANPRFHDLLGDNAFFDALGRLWGFGGTGMKYRPNSVRFYGEAASYKPRQPQPKGPRWVHVTANGILRRLGQGDPPALSALWVEILRGDPVEFWPINDGTNARQAASALSGGPPLIVTARDVFALLAVADWAPESYGSWLEPIGTPKEGQFFYLEGPVRMDTAATEWAGDFVFVVEPDSEFAICQMYCKGTGAGTAGDPRTEWLLRFYQPTGPETVLTWDLVRRVIDPGTTSTTIDTGTVAVIDGRLHHARLTTERVGADVQWEVWLDGVLLDNGTAAASPWTPLASALSVGGVNVGKAALGMVVVWDTAAPPFNAANAAIVGRAGELAADRLARLCLENDIDFELIGTAGQTVAMGPQPVNTFVGHVAEIERTDACRIVETRYKLGLTMRTRASMSAQPETLLLDVDDEGVLPPLEPDVDDLNVRNDVTVARTDGSSARSVAETGPLNVNSPTVDPQGVGRYPVKVDINPDVDESLPSHAGWRRSQGTQKGTRYPEVGVDLDAVPALAIDASAVDSGDIIGLDNAEPDRARLLELGYTETYRGHRRTITFNTGPAGGYDVFVLGTDRLASGGSTLTNAETSTGTAWELTTVAGSALWSQTAEPYDLRVAGERVTVTANNDASGPQDVTVTRSVNGVVKAQAAGEAVQIFQPAVLGL